MAERIENVEFCDWRVGLWAYRNNGGQGVFRQDWKIRICQKRSEIFLNNVDLGISLAAYLVDFQSASFCSMIQKHQRDKCPKISILFSHMCESIEVVKGPSEPHNLCNHFCINLSTFISYTPFFNSSVVSCCFNWNSPVLYLYKAAIRRMVTVRISSA